MGTRKIIHIDMDAFYASVEQRDHPQLRGKPVVVGGPPRSRGVVATASYEARRYGIRSAMPSMQALRLCPDAVFVLPRFEVYKAVSQQILAIFRKYTDLVEPLALDEAYLDVTSNSLNEPYATRLAKRIKEEVFLTTGLTCSAGVSFNKFLAKLASAWRKPNGLTVIIPEHAQAFVDQLPIEKFYGVGKATLKKMLACGIATGADLKRFGRERLHEHFGKMGDFFYGLSICEDDRVVNPTRVRKSIGRESTFEQDVSDPEALKALLKELCEDVSDSLKRHERKGRTVTLKIRYSDFKTITRSKTVPEAIYLPEAILAIVIPLFDAALVFPQRIRLMGISLSSLELQLPEQS